MIENNVISGKIKIKVEKYHGDVTQEEIDSGNAVPYEVIETEDTIENIEKLLGGN